MNGMIQLLVPEADRPSMLSQFPWDYDNTLKDEQRAHHITLGFKPSDDEMAALIASYRDKQVEFEAIEVRGNEAICALFGRLLVDGVPESTLRHITLGGTVPPKRSNELDEAAPYREPCRGRSLLQFHVVEF